jgi:hypothetical protein
LFEKDNLICYSKSEIRIVSSNKIKNKKYHTVEEVPKSNIEIAEKGKIADFPGFVRAFQLKVAELS